MESEAVNSGEVEDSFDAAYYLDISSEVPDLGFTDHDTVLSEEEPSTSIILSEPTALAA